MIRDGAEGGGSTTGGSFRIASFKREDKPALWALAERVRPQAKTNPERWAWQYERNPHAPTPGIAVAWHGDTVIGQMATMPVTARFLGSEVDACWQLDSMVDPQFRRRGIGSALFREQAGRYTLTAALGTSDAMFALRMKEGWTQVQPTLLLARPLKACEVLEAKIRSRSLARVLGYLYDRVYPVPPMGDARVSRVRAFDETATELWERVAPHLTIGIRRDARFLNWRYGDVPGKSYTRLELRAESGRLRGYCVASRLNKPGVFALADMLAMPDDEEAMVALTFSALHLAREAGAAKMLALATNPAMALCLAKCGFFKTRYKVRLTCAPNALPPHLLARSVNWYVTLGDSDEELTA